MIFILCTKKLWCYFFVNKSVLNILMDIFAILQPVFCCPNLQILMTNLLGCEI
jgi:hypothetical protein